MCRRSAHGHDDARVLDASRDKAEALRVYSGLCDTLRDELGVSPSADTRSVYEQLVVT